MAAMGVPADLGQTQREPLALIDLNRDYLVEASRADISSTFRVEIASLALGYCFLGGRG